MSSNFYINTDVLINPDKPTWEMTIGIEDAYLIGNMKREVTLILRIGGELDKWPGVLWHRHGYKVWWWFDKDDMDRFVTYFMLKYSGYDKTIWD
jgi:hypothetical protein